MNDIIIVQRAKATTNDHVGIGAIHVRGWQAAYAGLLPAAPLAALSVAERQESWRRRLVAPNPAAGDCECVLVARRVQQSSESGPAVATIGKQGKHNGDGNDRGSVLGWIGVGRSRDPDAVEDRDGEVWGIYVDPDHWGTGIGKRLMEEGLKVLKTTGYARFTLWMLKENKGARHFYGKLGFDTSGEEADTKAVEIFETRHEEVRCCKLLQHQETQ